MREKLNPVTQPVSLHIVHTVHVHVHQSSTLNTCTLTLTVSNVLPLNHGAKDSPEPVIIEEPGSKESPEPPPAPSRLKHSGSRRKSVKPSSRQGKSSPSPQHQEDTQRWAHIYRSTVSVCVCMCMPCCKDLNNKHVFL